MSTSYRELLGQVVPRPINSNAAYQRALRQIERLMCKPQRTRAEDDMIALLAMLIEQYEIGLGYDTPC
jgi:antitoxin component HigA of HigAB toxin-antitoxin module